MNKEDAFVVAVIKTGKVWGSPKTILDIKEGLSIFNTEFWDFSKVEFITSSFFPDGFLYSFDELIIPRGCVGCSARL